MNVRQRLTALANKHPELKLLANRLLREQMTPRWYRDYLALDCPFALKSRLLRAYIGDPSLISNPTEQYGSKKSSVRLFNTLLAQNPELPDTPIFAWKIKRQAIPPLFAKRLSLPRVSGNLLFRDWLFSGTFPERSADARVIRRLRQQCFFNKAAAQRCFAEERNRERGRTVFLRYFDTHIEDIWAPNIIYYLYFFLQWFYPTGMELMEKRIPTDMCAMIGIRKGSVLDLLMLIDLLYLGSRGVLSEKAVARRYPKVAVLIRYLKHKRFRKESTAFAAVGYLTPDYVPTLHQNRRGRRPSFFTLYLWFNMQSLLGYYNAAPIGRLYRHVDINRYNALAKRHYARYRRDTVSRLRRLLSIQPKINKRLELRSFVNIMIYLDTLIKQRRLQQDSSAKFDYLDALPSAARYQFGEEPELRSNRQPERSIGKVKRPDLRSRPGHYDANQWIERLLYSRGFGDRK